MAWDVIVIGGGHAGTEAAAAAARRGARTALLTFDAVTIGAMSCNPSIGGLGKGHLVREVDAFDGLMAKAADAAGIHYRLLNRSKGSAVQGPRVQADRKRYAAAIRTLLAGHAGLDIVTGEAVALRFASAAVVGVELADGAVLNASAVVLATGTFLGARLFRGEERGEGGRVDERAATRMAAQLRGLGLPVGRLKTGTPPRLDGRTIDWGRLAEQPSDSDAWTMSPATPRRTLPQLACAITRTNERTHDLVRDGLHRSPLFSGAIEAAGPRYCPSIEDKIHRFGDRDGHQLFLEPEGLDDHLVYPNGISTSLPTDVQRRLVASIAGLEEARIVAPGYAVEYDFLDPRGLGPTLAMDAVPGLFCAGQINGTTGYEEAAGQGLIAGINAAAHALGAAPLVLDRASSYLGVMVDDLTLQGVTEPYRMLTARAEYRLSLRANNAETRLSGIAQGLGCLGEARRRRLRDREAKRNRYEAALQAAVTAEMLIAWGADVDAGSPARSGEEWLRVAGVGHAQVLGSIDDADAMLLDELAEDARYRPYLARQDAEVQALRASDRITLLPGFDYAGVPGLSSEMVDRLSRARPSTLGAASRVRGITPAALSAILLHARKAAA